MINLRLERMRLAETVAVALREDIGTGDITTALIVPEGRMAKARILAKEAGIVAGLPVVYEVFRQVDPGVVVTGRVSDGDAIVDKQILADISGPAAAILTGERVALNFIQRLSGVATLTNRTVKDLEGTTARLLDTRKTTPGLRALEKYAVAVGGGTNHRFGLYDAILIKDNHIAVAGGISQAVAAARRGRPMTMKIEVEVETLAEVAEALQAGADVIMLDNMPLDEMRRAVTMVSGRAAIEASGLIGPRISAHDVAETGVDFISMGSLTYAARALDISLDIEV